MNGHGAITTHSPIRLDRARNSHADNDRVRRDMRRALLSMAEDILTDDELAMSIVAEHEDEFPELTIQYLRRMVALKIGRY